jgi:FtsZ-binding cell division protein ZapB/molecular chaperone GrpE (heat shock protein)
MAQVGSLPDLHIKTDILYAMKAFAKSKEQQEKWPGFAIYCMEVTATFMKYYEEIMRSEPTGKKIVNLSNMCDLSKLSQSVIDEFVTGTKRQIDVETLVKHMKQSSDITRKDKEIDDLRLVNNETTKKLHKLQQKYDDLTKQNFELSKNLAKSMQELENYTKQINTDISELRKNSEGIVLSAFKSFNDFCLKTTKFIENLDSTNASFQQTVVDTLGDMRKNLNFTMDNQAFDAFISSIGQVRADNLEFSTKNTELKLQIQKLKEENESLKQEKEDANISVSGIQLSEQTKDFLKEIDKYIKKVLSDEEADLNDLYLQESSYADMRSFDSDFGDNTDFSQHLKEIVKFARSCIVFFEICKLFFKNGFTSYLSNEKYVEFKTRLGVLSSFLNVLYGANNDTEKSSIDSYYSQLKSVYKLDLHHSPVFSIEYDINADKTICDKWCLLVENDISSEKFIQSPLFFEIILRNQRETLLYNFIKNLMYFMFFFATITPSLNLHVQYMRDIFKAYFPLDNSLDASNMLPIFERLKRVLTQIPLEKKENFPYTFFHQGLHSQKTIPMEISNISQMKILQKTNRTLFPFEIFCKKFFATLDTNYDPSEKEFDFDTIQRDILIL